MMRTLKPSGGHDPIRTRSKHINTDPTEKQTVKEPKRDYLQQHNRSRIIEARNAEMGEDEAESEIDEEPFSRVVVSGCVVV